MLNQIINNIKNFLREKVACYLSGAILLTGCMQPVSGDAEKETGIPSNIGDTSHLNTDTSRVNDRFKKQQPRQEIDFVGTGNEPFWAIETDFDRYLHFKTPVGIDIHCSAI
ncbi:hypothetical protein DC498_08030 [Terrimonas sp.]|uniref:hypothetical protein n=1 Tax=Terrimonas sp. TaxID=1914338 RepID=UPI000D50C36C|nr:hypothetical protein [Terrimonas sp.]PVD52863.1 hypothetical protein DC498_08030 [Terrimonas sp.]